MNILSQIGTQLMHHKAVNSKTDGSVRVGLHVKLQDVYLHSIGLQDEVFFTKRLRWGGILAVEENFLWRLFKIMRDIGSGRDYSDFGLINFPLPSHELK